MQIYNKKYAMSIAEAKFIKNYEKKTIIAVWLLLPFYHYIVTGMKMLLQIVYAIVAYCNQTKRTYKSMYQYIIPYNSSLYLIFSKNT